ncbi:hypothetical protein [Desulfocurvus sp. DL9XJH121]
MSWVLAVLAAGVALFFLLRARNQAARRFRDVLEARARDDEARKGKLDRDA